MSPSTTQHPEVAVDVIPLTWAEAPDDPLRGVLRIGMVDSTAIEPGGWALPGAYIQPTETVEEGAERVFDEKVGLPTPKKIIHLRPFSEPDRDPRRRTISLPVVALIPNREVDREALRGRWADLRSQRRGQPELVIDGKPVKPLFDHLEIIGTALSELRRRLDADDLRFLAGLLAPSFALRELERVWNAIVGEAANTPAFRRRMTSLTRPGPDRRGHWIEPTDQTGARSSGRPAKLYRWTND